MLHGRTRERGENFADLNILMVFDNFKVHQSSQRRSRVGTLISVAVIEKLSIIKHKHP